MNLPRLREYLRHFPGKRIAVIGDLMLDIYHRGSVARISPEAPVPVVSIDHIEHHPGGAANVAMNLRSLKASVDIFGVVGKDAHGKMLIGELRNSGIGVDGIIQVDSRPTSAKTRVIAGSQHVVRTDLEVTSALEDQLEEQLTGLIQEKLKSYDAVIMQDYNKGVLQPSLIRAIIDACRESGVLVTVDPKFQYLFEYSDASLVKPNLKEVEQILARQISTENEVEKAGRELMSRLHPDYLLITLGAKGMALFSRWDDSEHLPTQARHVADVSGAGDTVISTVTLALVSGASASESAEIGNVAAGRVCEEVGIVPIEYSVLEQALTGST